MSTARQVEVAPERLAGWVERFAASHGEVCWSIDHETSPSSWLGTAADGSWARLQGWGDAGPSEGPDEDLGRSAGAPLPASVVGGWAVPPGPLLVLLVRRGGYAVALASASGELVRHKVGTRHVQSRSAAGGWSQQRFARRRENQADALVEAVVGHARRVLEEGEGSCGARAGALVLGGDPRLVDQTLTALATGALVRLQGVPTRELRDLSDPRRAVLDEAVRRALAVRVEVLNA